MSYNMTCYYIAAVLLFFLPLSNSYSFWCGKDPYLAYTDVCKCRYELQKLVADCRNLELHVVPIFNSYDFPDVLLMHGTLYCETFVGLADRSCSEMRGESFF